MAEAFAADRPPKAWKVYAVKYRVGRAQRWFTIGQHGSPWTPQKAREKAATILRGAGDGIDHQSAKLARRDDLTISQLVDAYLEDRPAAKPDKRASTWAQDHSNLDRHIRPLLCHKIARDATKADVLSSQPRRIGIVDGRGL